MNLLDNFKSRLVFIFIDFLLTTIVFSQNKWNNTGPFGASISVIEQTMISNTENPVFIGTENGMIFKSIDVGENWELIYDYLRGQIYNIYISPDYNNDLTIYAHLENQDGMIKTTDGGKSWTKIFDGWLKENNYLRGFCFSPSYAIDQTIFLSCREGIFKSIDRGNKWQISSSGILVSSTGEYYTGVIKVSPNYKNDQTLFVVGYLSYSNYNHHLYKSTDGGENWSSVLEKRYPGPIFISPNFSTDSTIIVSSDLSNATLDISQNAGRTWSQIGSGNKVAVSPNFATDHKVYSIKFNYPKFSPNYSIISYSDNFGLQWAVLDTLWGEQIMDIKLSPHHPTDHIILLGTQAHGVLKSIDNGFTWLPSNQGITGWNISDVVVSPTFTADSTIFVGTGSGGIFKSTNGGVTWQNSENGIDNFRIYPNCMAISPFYQLDGTVFAATAVGHEESYNPIFKTTDWGHSWINIGSWGWTKTLAVSSNFINDKIVYTGGAISFDGGNSFNFISPPAATIYTISFSPYFANDSTVFLGTLRGNGQGVFKSTDAMKTWALSLESPNLHINTVATSPSYESDKTVFATLSYSGNVYRSTNGGSDWSVINNVISEGSAGHIIFSPNYVNDKSLFLATDGYKPGTQGVYYSSNSGSNWFSLGKGLPENLSFTRLSISNSSPYILFVGTRRKGLWYTEFDEPTNVEINESNLPNLIKLSQNYPNPFNPVTFISFQLPTREKIDIIIYNQIGQIVKQLVSKEMSAGYHEVIWDAKNLNGQFVANGIYICKMQAGKIQKTIKMLLLK